MAKKSKASSKPAPDTRVSRMFPLYHQDVVNAMSPEVLPVWFCKKANETNTTDEYKTHIMGRFACVNSACSTGSWGSKKVAIVIRGYAANGYNADVFYQRCKACDELGRMIVDKSSYVDRVVYRVQKWAGIAMERPTYSSKRGRPHRADLCEGCKMGVCQQDND